ncbi:hypothetical protein RW25_26610 [Bacillus sp. L_1B0_8]|uniref:Uncharacterized protein n=2 Tax=Bacillus thuringiensis TaxID=1428 RepID=A0A9X7AMI2_BACTU|nr:hypothetical protein AC241_12740 [Bacillus thuringiensis]KIQ79791.1 hypothetical protein RW25_26610 [Bacillus sp. L_1B0_8]KIQ85167.1 hypothetical protein RT27_20160 [Bacillus sp. L_1B0_5]OUB52190.1 hypothetical protein BK716_12255 [Bacillus thuringiensis serovar higo]PEL95506.1 hypothetical protein CN602_28250 [Bacillus cereus]
MKIIYEKVIGRFCRIYVSMIIQISYSNHSTDELLEKWKGKEQNSGRYKEAFSLSQQKLLVSLLKSYI